MEEVELNVPNIAIAVIDVQMITHNMLKQFLGRHMKRHGINYLEKHENVFIML